MSDRNPVFVVLASFLTGLGCFTRMEGTGVILILCLWSTWLLLYQERSIKSLAQFLMVFFISFPVLFAGPLYMIKGKTGIWELGHTATKIPILITQDSKIAGADSAPVKTPTERNSPEKIVANKYIFSIWETFYKFFRSLHVIFIVLFIFGITRRKIIPYSKNEMPILIWSCVFLAIAMLYTYKESHMSTRHGLLMGIPVLVWISIGFLEVGARLEMFLSKKCWAERYGRHVMIYLMAIICLVVLPKTLTSASSDKAEMKKAGIYLKKAGYSENIIAVQPRINRLVFYMEAKSVDIPSMGYEALPGFLRTTGSTYVIVDEHTVNEEIKGFREHAGSMGLTKIDIAEFQKYKEYSFALYRIASIP